MLYSPYAGPVQPGFVPSLCGPLQLVTPPSGSALAIDPRSQGSSLAMAKSYLRITADQTADDDVIKQAIQGATRFCEERIEGARTFLNTTWDLPVSRWWFEQSGTSLWGDGCSGRQRPANGMGEQLAIPLPPLASVTSVKYYDTTGVEQTLASTFYIVRTPRRQEGTIERASLQVFPPVQCDREYPITIRFVAGYGDGLATFPPVEVQSAILLVAGWLYGDREPTTRDLDSVDSLLRTVAYGVYG